MRRFIAYICLLGSILSAGARGDASYYPRHQIGAGNGLTYALNPDFSEYGRIGLMGKHRCALNLSFDYQYFFNRNWGLTANILFPDYNGEDPERWIPRVEGLGEEHFFADMSDKHWQTYSTYQCNISAGIVYRVCLGPWSILPSAGVGVSLYNGNGNISYYVMPPGAEHTEYVEMKFDGNSSRQAVMSINLGVTAQRHLSKWLSIWLRPSLIISCGSISSSLVRTDDILHQVIGTIDYRQRPGSYFNLQLGLSLTIGEVR